ncbi:MAG TPA: hypothetical protein VM581_04660, partial [Magnetospirillaceae bacterium]|nr:hypothetical protein [Magnetospirillaceae bacterium]
MSSGDALYYSDSAALRFKSNEPGIRRPQLYSLPHREFDIAERFGTFTTMPAAEAVLASPLFGAWLDRIAQAAYSEAPNKARFALGKQRAQHIGNYIVTAAFWGGNEIETQAWQEDGYVMIPEIGRVALQGADGLVSVEVHDGLTIHSDDTTIHL